MWLVDTASNTVLVYRRSTPASKEFDVALELGAGELVVAPLLDGFALDIAALFND